MLGIKKRFFLKAPAFWWKSEQRPWVQGLACFSFIWKGLSWIKELLASPPSKAPYPVISVGNLVVGGAGKTPVVRWLGQLLKTMSKAPLVVSRGYGGNIRNPLKVDPNHHTFDQVGDEALCTSIHLPSYIASPRSTVIPLLKNAPTNSILILDDGHQHTALSKDLSFVVVDAGQGFGNGQLLPAGPLREPITTGLRRADGIIVIGKPAPGLLELMHQQAAHIPVFKATLVPLPSLAPQTQVVGFAGIGFPKKVEQTLHELNLEVLDFEAFPDHYPYTQADLVRLRQRAKDLGAQLVTTEKDWIRIPKDFQKQVHVIQVEIVMEPSSQKAFKALLGHRLTQKKRVA